jgi:hypothetical protein
MKEDINTHGLVVDFGKHNGTLYTRVPVGYLFWMVNNNHSRKDIASSELKRRGSVIPKIEVSGHAIDRASLYCRKIWHETKIKDEGIHSWLVRVAQEAIESVEGNISDSKIKYLGMKFVFENGDEFPVLKTVMR